MRPLAPNRPSGRELRTRKTTLRIPQQNQLLTRSVQNPAVISFGENGARREPFGPSGAKAGQQAQLGKPAVNGFLSPPPMRQRLSDRR